MKLKNKILIISFVLSNIAFAQETLSLSLEQAIERTKTENVNKKLAALDVEKADQKIKETKAIGLPQLNGTVDYNYNIKQPVSLLPAEIFGGQPGEFSEVVFGTKQSLSAGATLTQLLFDGSYLVGLESAKAYKKISELALDKTDEALTEAVLLAYSSAIITQENLKILEKNKSVTEKNLHDITEIYKVGLGEEQSVDQMQYNKNAIDNSIVNLKNSQKIIIQNLKYVLNIKPDTELNLTTSFEDLISKNVTLLEENTEPDFTNHIDYKLIENELLTNELQLKYEKSKSLPSANAFLSSTYNAYSEKFDFFDQKYFNTTVFGLGVTVPIFSGFSRKAKVSQAQIEINKTELRKENLVQELNKNASEKELNYQNAISQLDLAKSQIALAEKIYKKEEIKFYEGIGNSNDLSQAENQKYQAQSQYIQSIYQVIQQKIALDKALGNY